MKIKRMGLKPGYHFGEFDRDYNDYTVRFNCFADDGEVFIAYASMRRGMYTICDGKDIPLDLNFDFCNITSSSLNGLREKLGSEFERIRVAHAQ